MHSAESAASLPDARHSVFASDDQSRRPAFVSYFGLRENPFRNTSDPRYLLRTAQTQNALDGLMGGISTRAGLLVLTGEVGSGKTVLLNTLLDLLRQRGVPRAFIFNSHLEANELFEMALAEFGASLEARTHANPSARLEQWLKDCYRANSNPVLIVDEAQGLKIEVLEAIRMLLNLEAGGEKLLQIVLSGQPEFDTKIDMPELRQLRQRIALRCRLRAMTLEETCLYIEHRLRVAGAAGDPAFEPEALAAVHYYAQGTPRVINALCEQALMRACAERSRPVPTKTIEEISFQFQADGRQFGGPPLQLGDLMMMNAVAARSKRANAMIAIAASSSSGSATRQPEPPGAAQQPEPKVAAQTPVAPTDSSLEPASLPVETVTPLDSVPLPANPVAPSRPVLKEPRIDSGIALVRAPAPLPLPRTVAVPARPARVPVRADARARLSLLVSLSSIERVASNWLRWLREPFAPGRGANGAAHRKPR
jgi:general secretion pathway protein A